MSDMQLFFIAFAAVVVVFGAVMSWGAWKFRGDVF